MTMKCPDMKEKRRLIKVRRGAAHEGGGHLKMRKSLRVSEELLFPWIPYRAKDGFHFSL